MAEPSGSALARQTLARLKERVACGEWAVGERIPTEPELTAELGVGRSTVREAIRSLATLGMVESLTARGTFVRSRTPTPSLLLEALSAYTPAELIGFRRAIDVEAAQAAAAQRSDEDLRAMEQALTDEMDPAHRGVDEAPAGSASRCSRFHGTIARASGNRLLADLEANLSAAMDASGVADSVATSLDPAAVIAEHDRLFTCIRSGDVARAAHFMAVHVDNTLRCVGQGLTASELTALTPTGDLPGRGRLGAA